MRHLEGKGASSLNSACVSRSITRNVNTSIKLVYLLTNRNGSVSTYGETTVTTLSTKLLTMLICALFTVLWQIQRILLHRRKKNIFWLNVHLPPSGQIRYKHAFWCADLLKLPVLSCNPGNITILSLSLGKYNPPPWAFGPYTFLLFSWCLPVLSTGPQTERTQLLQHHRFMRNRNQLLLSSQVIIYLVRSKVLRINTQAGWEQGWTARAARTPMPSLSFTAVSSTGFNKHDIRSKQKPLGYFSFPTRFSYCSLCISATDSGLHLAQYLVYYKYLTQNKNNPGDRGLWTRTHNRDTTPWGEESR